MIRPFGYDQEQF